MNNASKEFSHIKSYPERMVGFFPLPFWGSWVLIWSLIYAVDLILSFQTGQHHNHMTELGVAAFCASLSINLCFTSRIMINLYQDFKLFIDTPDEDLKPWYEKKLRVMYQGVAPIAVGIVFALLVELTVSSVIDTYNQSSRELLYFRTAYRIFGFFLLGTSLWSTVNFMRLPSQLSEFSFKLRLSNLSGIGLQAIGSTFLRLALMGAISYFLLVITILLSPVNKDSTILIWTVIGALVILCLFLLPQIGVHRIMAAEKKKQLISFTHHLEEALSSSMKSPTPENMKTLKEMFELQHYLKGLNDWPFNMTALWQLISALLIPLLLVLIQIKFRI